MANSKSSLAEPPKETDFMPLTAIVWEVCKDEDDNGTLDRIIERQVQACKNQYPSQWLRDNTGNSLVSLWGESPSWSSNQALLLFFFHQYVPGLAGAKTDQAKKKLVSALLASGKAYDEAMGKTTEPTSTILSALDLDPKTHAGMLLSTFHKGLLDYYLADANKTGVSNRATDKFLNVTFLRDTADNLVQTLEKLENADQKVLDSVRAFINASRGHIAWLQTAHNRPEDDRKPVREERGMNSQRPLFPQRLKLPGFDTYDWCRPGKYQVTTYSNTSSYNPPYNVDSYRPQGLNPRKRRHSTEETLPARGPSPEVQQKIPPPWDPSSNWYRSDDYNRRRHSSFVRRDRGYHSAFGTNNNWRDSPNRVPVMARGRSLYRDGEEAPVYNGGQTRPRWYPPARERDWSREPYRHVRERDRSLSPARPLARTPSRPRSDRVRHERRRSDIQSASQAAGVQNASAQPTSTQWTVGQYIIGRQTVGQQTSSELISSQQASAQLASSEQMSSQQTVGQLTLGQRASAQQTSAGQTMGGLAHAVGQLTLGHHVVTRGRGGHHGGRRRRRTGRSQQRRREEYDHYAPGPQ